MQTIHIVPIKGLPILFIIKACLIVKKIRNDEERQLLLGESIIRGQFEANSKEAADFEILKFPPVPKAASVIHSLIGI